MTKKILSGTLLDEQVHLSLTEFCQACSSGTEWVIELVEEGILEPSGEERPVTGVGEGCSGPHVPADLVQLG